VFLRKPDGFAERYTPEDIPLDIRHEDDDLLVIHKPPGMVDLQIDQGLSIELIKTLLV